MLFLFLLSFVLMNSLQSIPVNAHEYKYRSIPKIENHIQTSVSLSVIDVEGDVIMGNHLPMWGAVCDPPVAVRSGPHDEAQILYYIFQQDYVVRLREQSRGEDRSWVMIRPANWIKLSSLCNGD